MNENIQFALKKAILQSLPILQSLLGSYSDQSQVWTKYDEGSWRSEYKLKPYLFKVFNAAENQLNENGASFTKLFFENYPEYEGMVCFGGFGGRNFSDRVSIFKAVIKRLWIRYETFNCNDSEVDEIVEEVIQFVKHKPQDKIVDAVIGMEVLLLAALGKDDRKGELSFRFSLNYSMLFPSDKRPSAFKLARDLYNIRSTIAHGSSIDENKIDLSDAANKATEVLRIIISRFLPEKGAPYKKDEFWKNKYFGLENSD